MREVRGDSVLRDLKSEELQGENCYETQTIYRFPDFVGGRSSGGGHTQSGPVPIAAVGRASVDAAGNVTGTEARSVAGGYAEETLSGTISVNPDCTGSMTIRFYE